MKSFVILLLTLCFASVGIAQIEIPITGTGGNPAPVCTVAQLLARTGPCSSLTPQGGEIAVVTDATGDSCTTGGSNKRVPCTYNERMVAWTPIWGMATTAGGALNMAGAGGITNTSSLDFAGNPCTGLTNGRLTTNTGGLVSCVEDVLGGSGGAESYITSATTAGLTNEKVLTGGAGVDVAITGTDGGAATLTFDGSEIQDFTFGNTGTVTFELNSTIPNLITSNANGSLDITGALGASIGLGTTGDFSVTAGGSLTDSRVQLPTGSIGAGELVTASIGRTAIDETLLSIQTDATNCSGLTCDAGSDGEQCFQRNTDILYVCDGPEAAWKLIAVGTNSAANLVDDIPCAANDYYRRNGADNGWTCAAGSGGVVDGDTLTVGLTFPASGLHLREPGGGAEDLIINAGTNVTADRTLTIATGNADRILTITGDATVIGTNTGDQTTVSGNAGTVTFADAAADTTTFVALGTAATGPLAPATDAGLAYNASTNALTMTGALTASSYGGITEANLVDKTAPETITGDWDFGGGGIAVENGTNPPACTAGQLFVNNGAASGRRLMACETTTFVTQGTTGDVTTVGDCTTGDCFTGASGTLLKSNGDLIMELDDNNDASESFQIKDGANAIIAEIQESGAADFAGAVTATSFTADDPGDGSRGLDITTNTSQIGAGAGTSPVSCKLGFVGTTLNKHCNGGALTSLETREFCWAISDYNTTAISAATGLATEYIGGAGAFTVTGVRAFVRTAPTVSGVTIDINEAGTTIMASTKLTIDVSENTGGSSTMQGTAATAAVVSDTSIALDAVITVDVDAVGTGAKGGVVCIMGRF